CARSYYYGCPFAYW
nr:immunoglobulin heavy chain junction region [Mus musculus]